MSVTVQRDIIGSKSRLHLAIEISVGFPLFSSGDKMRFLRDKQVL